MYPPPPIFPCKLGRNLLGRTMESMVVRDEHERERPVPCLAPRPWHAVYRKTECVDG